MSRRWNAQPVALTLVILIWVSPPLLAEGPWLPLLGGLAGQNIWALEVSPSGYILAGTAEYEPKTMFRSTDFGITWIEVSGLPSNVEIWDIEIDPTNESIVYAGLNGAGVWKSLDAGISWDSSNLDGQVWAVDVSPSNPSFVYAASQTGGIYRSADGGEQLELGFARLLRQCSCGCRTPRRPRHRLRRNTIPGSFQDHGWRDDLVGH